MNVSLFASTIGWPEGKKATTNYSSSIEHHFL